MSAAQNEGRLKRKRPQPANWELHARTCIDSQLVPAALDLCILAAVQVIQLSHMPCCLLVQRLLGSVACELVQESHQHLRRPALDVIWRGT